MSQPIQIVINEPDRKLRSFNVDTKTCIAIEQFLEGLENGDPLIPIHRSTIVDHILPMIEYFTASESFRRQGRPLKPEDEERYRDRLSIVSALQTRCAVWDSAEKS